MGNRSKWQLFSWWSEPGLTVEEKLGCLHPCLPKAMSQSGVPVLRSIPGTQCTGVSPKLTSLYTCLKVIFSHELVPPYSTTSTADTAPEAGILTGCRGGAASQNQKTWAKKGTHILPPSPSPLLPTGNPFQTCVCPWCPSPVGCWQRWAQARAEGELIPSTPCCTGQRHSRPHV